MSKKTLRLLLVVFPILFLGLMVYLFINFQKKKVIADQLKNIPSFNLQTIDGNNFTTANLESDKYKVLIYISPECHFCQGEALELSKIYKEYPNVQWVWIASEPLQEIKTFAEKYSLNQKENIHWCHDDMAKLFQKFGMTSVPFFLAYNKENQQVFRNKGAIKLEKLLKSFDEGK